MSKKPDIEETFRAAGRLIYEWQDTLLYLSIVIGETLAITHKAAYLTALILLVPIVRETERQKYWFKDSEQIYAGHNALPVNNMKNSGASGLMLSNFMLGFAVTMNPAHPSFLNLIPAAYALRLSYNSYNLLKSDGGKLSDIWSLYGILNSKTGMWDWARKKDNGGGGTQTEKLVRGFKGLARKVGSAIGGVLPQPAPPQEPAYAFVGQQGPKFVG